MSEAPASQPVDVSVIMPCLDEAATVGACIDRAREALAGSGLTFEVVIGDNGSTDGSQRVAVEHGARVVSVERRGYGHAIRGAVSEARGRLLVMGDADGTYDFGQAPAFARRLDEGFDLVMGSRFAGGIEPGAMPWLHRYLGVPLLTGMLNLFFRAGISDAHCGLRAFTREAFARLALKTGGMELASEMVIRAAQEGLRIAELPTTLRPNRRHRRPHLRTFRDGWRHLRFMLMFSPSWLFVVPGMLAVVPGLLLLGLLPFVELEIAGHPLSFHFSILGALATLLGTTILQFGVFAKVVFVANHLGRDRIGGWFLRDFHLELALVAGLTIVLAGLAGDGVVLYGWLATGRGALGPRVTALTLLATTAIVVGAQLVFAAFFLGILRGSYTGRWLD